MPANMSIFHAGGIYRKIPAFTGKYRQILENGIFHPGIIKQNPTSNIDIWVISIIEVRDTNNMDLLAS